MKFFKEEKIVDKFEIKFIEIPKSNLPPTHFRSGQSVVSKAQIERMANSIVLYLQANKLKSYKLVIAYCRGAYLEAVRLANKKLQATSYPPATPERSDGGRGNLQPIQEIFTDEELAVLKKKGIRWMKIGLRMPEAFEIFRKRIKGIVQNNESKQLKLF